MEPRVMKRIPICDLCDPAQEHLSGWSEHACSRHLFAALSHPAIEGTGDSAAALEQVIKCVARLQIQHLKNPEAKAVRLHATQAPFHCHVGAVPITKRGLLPCALSAQLEDYRLPRNRSKRPRSGRE